mmetsp:Transcript_114904/g.357968  ORF Transcript_114904/g.357968 Transcript_114904/m.357968 type:complete len:218 (+) Transcript_114904:1394-2047(+)
MLAQLQALVDLAEEDAPAVAHAAHVVARGEDREGPAAVRGHSSPKAPWHFMRADNEGYIVPLAELDGLSFDEAVPAPQLTGLLLLHAVTRVGPDQVEEDVVVAVLVHLQGRSHPVNALDVVLQGDGSLLPRAVHRDAAVQHAEVPAAGERARDHGGQRQQGEDDLGAQVPYRAEVHLELGLQLCPESEVQADGYILVVAALYVDRARYIPFDGKEQE